MCQNRGTPTNYSPLLFETKVSRVPSKKAPTLEWLDSFPELAKGQRWAYAARASGLVTSGLNVGGAWRDFPESVGLAFCPTPLRDIFGLRGRGRALSEICYVGVVLFGRGILRAHQR